MIFVAHKRSKEKSIISKYGECTIVDVTSKANGEIRKLSPFYPHGKIPIPNSDFTSESVEGIWQGLKVFHKKGIDYKSFDNRTGKNIKRTVRKFGLPKGHQYGTDSNEILSYIEARLKIYLPVYKYVLENHCSHIIDRLRTAAQVKTIVLLDYTTNGNVFDGSTPLSHAQLVRSFTLGEYEDLYSRIDEITTDELSVSVEIPELDIIKLIENNPLSSRQIIDTLKLNVSTGKLTSNLKKSNSVITVKGSPLRFKSLKENLRLF